MLRVEVAERRLHEIVVPQVAVILDELLVAVVRASAMDGLMKRRHTYTGRQRMEYDLSALERARAEYPGKTMKDLAQLVSSSARVRT